MPSGASLTPYSTPVASHDAKSGLFRYGVCAPMLYLIPFSLIYLAAFLPPSIHAFALSALIVVPPK